MRYSVINCYPTFIGSIDLNWAQRNEFASFRVNMTYERYIALSTSELPQGTADVIPFPEINAKNLLLAATNALRGASNVPTTTIANGLSDLTTFPFQDINLGRPVEIASTITADRFTG